MDEDVETGLEPVATASVIGAAGPERSSVVGAEDPSAACRPSATRWVCPGPGVKLWRGIAASRRETACAGLWLGGPRARKSLATSCLRNQAPIPEGTSKGASEV